MQATNIYPISRENDQFAFALMLDHGQKIEIVAQSIHPLFHFIPHSLFL